MEALHCGGLALAGDGSKQAHYREETATNANDE
jgi:hypothetical protein